MKQTRTNRKNNTPNTSNTPKGPKNNTPEKIYYGIIAVLLVVLIGIMAFIFMNRESAVDFDADNGTPDSEFLTDTEDEDEDDLEEEPAEEDQNNNGEEEASDTDEEPVDDSDDETAEDTEVDSEEEEDTSDETSYEVTENAPLDETHNTNYSEGSSDRVAIANAVSSVTGLNQSDMITWRVGNNGPGQVFAVMSDSGRNDVYRVLLQFGDGQWHVTSVEELAEVPAEFR
jgi:cell division protein FtsN